MKPFESTDDPVALELRDLLLLALGDVVRSATVKEYEEAVARYDRLADELRRRP